MPSISSFKKWIQQTHVHGDIASYSSYIFVIPCLISMKLYQAFTNIFPCEKYKIGHAQKLVFWVTKLNRSVWLENPLSVCSHWANNWLSQDNKWIFINGFIIIKHYYSAVVTTILDYIVEWILKKSNLDSSNSTESSS